MSIDTEQETAADVARQLGLGAVEQSRVRRLLRSKWIIAALVLLCLVVVGLSRSLRRAAVSPYKTESVQRGDLTVRVTATGNLQPINQVDVSSELSGIMREVRVDFNDRVTQGQVLAQLDVTKLDAQVTQSHAALEAASARLLQTQATVKETAAKLAQFQKVRELSHNKLPSQLEYNAAVAASERALADEAAARASVAQATATLEANRTDRSRAVIISPINGVVLTRSIEPGQTVAASFSAPVLFTLAEDLAKMELHVNVDEADIGKVREGEAATFTVSAYPNRTFNAHIVQTRLSSVATSGVVTYETVMTVDNADLALRPGMTATAEILVAETHDVLLVPNAALRFMPPVKEKAAAKGSSNLLSSLVPRPRGRRQQQNDQKAAAKAGGDRTHQVWVLENDEPKRVEVQVGATDGSFTEITGGELAPGTAVIVDTVSAEN